MSLINDALKRARQAQKRPAISPSVEGILIAPPPLQPVEEVRPEPSQRLLVVIPVLLLSLGASFWFLWKWNDSKTLTAASVHRLELTEGPSTRTEKTNVLARASATLAQWQERQQSVPIEPSTEADASAPAEAQKTREGRTEASLGNTSAAGITSALPNVAAAGNGVSSVGASSVTSATAPALAKVAINSTVPVVTPVSTNAKLQGIFYRLKGPTAVIDGRIVSLGDDINGYRVIRIERDAVKLVAAGRTNTLTLH